MSKGKAIRKSIVFIVCLSTTIILGAVGIWMPPKGEIDNSMLVFFGLLALYATISQIPVIIQVAGYVKMTKGDMTIEAKGIDQKQND